MKFKKMWSVLLFHIWYYHGIMCHKIAQKNPHQDLVSEPKTRGSLYLFDPILINQIRTKFQESPQRRSCVRHLRSVYQEVMVMILLTRVSRMALITAFMDWVYPVTTEKMETGKPRQDMITSCPLKWAFRLSAEKISASTTWKRQTGKQVTLMWILRYIYFS